MKIGVFDSGKGGLSFVKAIKAAIPEAEVIFEHDARNVPYGHKGPKDLLKLALPKIKKLEAADCEVIVVACNTVTMTIIDDVRAVVKTPIVAIEPMIKPAASLTASKVIAVCATPTTLTSKKYDQLISKYAKDLTVIEPDCSNWSSMIENDSVDLQKLTDSINYVCKRGADVIVLACTHYHWISDLIDSIAKTYGAKVIYPERPVVKQLKRVLARLP